MINYNRLGYEIKTGFSKFLRKNFNHTYFIHDSFPSLFAIHSMFVENVFSIYKVPKN